MIENIYVDDEFADDLYGIRLFVKTTESLYEGKLWDADDYEWDWRHIVPVERTDLRATTPDDTETEALGVEDKEIFALLEKARNEYLRTRPMLRRLFEQQRKQDKRERAKRQLAAGAAQRSRPSVATKVGPAAS